MIDPYSGLMEVKTEFGVYLKTETNDAHEGRGILNPYTGVLEVEPEYPGTEYLDLDKILDDTEDTMLDTENGDFKSKKSRERVWHETNKQEWLNIYQRYMEGRLQRQPKREIRNVFKTQESEEMDEKNEFTDPNMDTVDDGEDRNGEYEDVQYLSEEHSAEEDDTLYPTKPGRRPDRNMAAAMRAVARYGASRLQAAREYRVPLDALCARLQRLHACCHGKLKNRIINNDKLLKLRDSSLKILKYSNVCLFKCTKNGLACYCRQRFKDMATLRAHAETAHNYTEIRRKILKYKHWFHRADITDLRCGKCQTVAGDLNELQTHLKSHGIIFQIDGSSLVPYELCSDRLMCQLCKAKFTSKGLLLKHMDAHFLNHACDVCYMGFHNARSLKIHHCHSHKKIKCSICGVVLKNSYFKKKHDSKVHSLQAKGASHRFKCSYCPAKFKYDYKRLQHLIEEHDGETDLFPCEFCPKIFMTVHWCSKHMNSVHREELDEIYK